MPEPDGHEPLGDWDRVLAETRAALMGMTFTQILGALVHACARRGVVGAHADELEVIALQRRLQVRAAEMARVLRELRTNARSTFDGWSADGRSMRRPAKTRYHRLVSRRTGPRQR
jgi:hypothetical protein